MSGAKGTYNFFYERYMELVGGPDTQTSEIKALYREYLACPVAGSIESFIRQSGEFAAKSARLVQTVYDVVISSAPALKSAPPVVPRALLERFVQRLVVGSDVYSVEALHEDLMAACMDLLAPPPPSVLPPPGAGGGDAGGAFAGSSEAAATAVLESTTTTSTRESGVYNGSGCRLLSPAPTTVFVPAEFDVEYAAAFEAEYDRPMFLQEYFHFKRLYATRQDLEPHLPSLHAAFDEVYVATRQTYLCFLGRGLSMHEFVKRHMADFEAPGFLAELTERMITTDEYTSCMSDKVRSVYRALYDEEEDMRDEDAGFLVRRLRARKVPVNDEGLSMDVANFYNESVQIGERVQQCYASILRRPAERAEKSEHVREYRRMYDADLSERSGAEFEEVLGHKLIATLEFHDVLKSIIHASLSGGADDSSPQVRKPVVYSVLARVLTRMTPRETLASVQDHVNAVIVDLGSGL